MRVLRRIERRVTALETDVQVRREMELRAIKEQSFARSRDCARAVERHAFVCSEMARSAMSSVSFGAPPEPAPATRSRTQDLPPHRVRRLLCVSSGRQIRLWVLAEKVKKYDDPDGAIATGPVRRREWLALAIAVLGLALRPNKGQANVD
jgi:hypothetical protein